MRSGFVNRHLARGFTGPPGPYVQCLLRAREQELAALMDEGVPRPCLVQAMEGADWSDWRWPELREPAAPCHASPDVEVLTRRLLCAVALEGVRCLDDGTVGSAAEADVGSIVGAGYPRWTGGVLSYVETVGLAPFVAEAQALAQSYGARYAPPPSLVERACTGRGFYR